MAKQIVFDIIARDKASGVFSKIGGAAKILGVVGLGGIAASAVNTEAQFSKTMNVLQATTNSSSEEMEKLRDLAVKMGADTSFSANDASQAMLELARGGMNAATIQGGALQGTLTLAAAGELDMATAANTAVKAMGAFNLTGKDMDSVAAALAGGANASSASVLDMSSALAQSGLSAKAAGLSIQETTGILAAFSNAGLEGSDAGTSLKTMLARLQPTTTTAAKAFEKLGLFSKETGSAFVKSNGDFKSATQIAGLLANATKKLGEAEKARLLGQAFGSDAQRAAIALSEEGEKGLRKMIKATSDEAAAEKMAAANMKGTAGALERMKGSLETASLAIGQLLAPAVVFASDKVAMLANEFVKFMPKIKATTGFIKDHQVAFGALAVAIGAVVAITKIHAAVMAVQAAGGLLAMIKATNLAATATKAYAAVQWVLNAALTANPIGLIVVAIAALALGLVLAYKKSETFRKIVNAAFDGVKKAVGAVADFITKKVPAAFDKVKDAAGNAIGWVKANWPKILAILTGPIGIAVLVIAKNWDKIKAGGANLLDWFKSIPGKLRDFFSGLGGIISAPFEAAFAQIKSWWNATVGGFGFSVPDWVPKVGGNEFRIPEMAKGGIVTRPTLALIGEAGPEAVIPLTGARGRGFGGGPQQPVIVQLVLPNGKVIEQILIEHSRTTGRPLQVRTLGATA